MRTLRSIAALALAIAAAFVPAAQAATPMVSSSSSHSLALKSDGTVVAWGSDRYGALGTGRMLGTNVGVKIQGLPRVVSFAAADDAVAAVDTQGQVWTWGPGVGLLGPRESSMRAIPARISGLSNVVQVEVRYRYGVAVRRDGTVVCWSNCPAASTPLAGAPGLATIDGLVDVVQVAAGQTQLLALRRDGTVMSMGQNFYGDVGDGTKSPRNTPYLIPQLSGIVSVAAALAHSVALRNDGKVFYWGSNYPSALNAPVELTGLGGAAIAVGADGNINTALRADGTVWRWDHSITLKQAPGFSGARAMGSVDGAGEFANSNLAVVGADGKVRVVGQNFEGQLGDGSTVSFSGTPVTVANVSGAIAVRAFRYGLVALTSSGELWAWGANGNIIGAGAEYDRSRPFVVPGLSGIVSVAAGQDMSYALASNGRVYSWGANTAGKLGRPGGSSAEPALIPGLTSVMQVAAGHDHALFVRSDSSLWTVGAYPADCSTPCAVRNEGGNPVTGMKTTRGAIATGWSTSYAVTTGGVLVAWGANTLGQLGVGHQTNMAYPVSVHVPGPITQVSTQRATVLAMRGLPGEVYAWGDNITAAAGPTGPGNTQVLTPRLVPGFDGAMTIASGWYHSLALRFDGAVLAMGNNFRGELGDGTTTQRSIPATVLDIAAEDVVSLSAGEARSFAVRSDGLVYGWGAPNGSGFGNLADGTFVRRARPAVAISEKDDANIDDVGCTQSTLDRFWYLDLDPASCFAVPAAKVPSLLPVAAYSTGGNDATSIGTEISYRRADFGTTKKTYVLGAVPPEFLDNVPLAPGQADAVLKAKAGAPKAGGLVIVQLTAAGWSVVSGQISAYFTGITEAERRSIRLLESVPAAKIPGAQFCVGYGDSVDQMLASQQLRVVATVPGTELALTLPCLLSGTYLNGPESSLQGQSVTFTAAVVGEGPTGTVQFKDGAANIGAAVVVAAASSSIATASRATSSLAPGSHSITAAYSGNGNPVNPPSTSGTLVHAVLASKGTSTTTLTAPARSLAGSPIALLATVGGSAPTGAVTFRANGSTLGTVNLSGGVARFEARDLALPGTYSITADYGGDAGNLASSAAAVSVLVFMAETESGIRLQGPAGDVNVGQSAAFTVTVTGASNGVIDLYERTTVVASAALSGGSATLATSFATPGVRFVHAHLRPDGATPGAYSGNVAVSVVGATLDPAADADGDGIPNGVEIAEGRDPTAKDNDIFGSARLFTMQQYRDFLGREGDGGGVDFWAGQIGSGARSRAQGVENFFQSPEFQQTGAPVARLYFAYFLRIPDYAGLMFWMGQFRAGTALDAISEEFAKSPEFAGTYGALTNAQFVDRVYRNVLGRPPEAAGLAFWTAQLDSGARNRGQVMTGFSESDEYGGAIANEIYVTMMYAGMLRRGPEAAGFSFWVDYLDRGNSGLTLIEGFLSASEYRNRFLP